MTGGSAAGTVWAHSSRSPRTRHGGSIMVVRSNRLALGIGFALAAASPLGCGGSSHNASDAGSVPGDGSGPGPGDSGVPDGPPPGSLEFFSSFEPGEQLVAATDTVEVDSLGVKRSAGVTGSPSTLILGNIMRQVAGVTAAGTSPSQEMPPKIADGDLTTKWLVFARTGAGRIQLAAPVAVKRYAVSSANDVPGRDPATWTLEGSQDGQGWTAIDTRTGEMFGDRFETHRYDFENATAYLYYRLNVTATRDPGLNILQIAELQLSDGDNTPLPVTDMKSGVGPGPGGSHNAMLSRGFTGMQAFRF